MSVLGSVCVPGAITLSLPNHINPCVDCKRLRLAYFLHSMSICVNDPVTRMLHEKRASTGAILLAQVKLIWKHCEHCTLSVVLS